MKVYSELNDSFLKKALCNVHLIKLNYEPGLYNKPNQGDNCPCYFTTRLQFELSTSRVAQLWIR